MLGKHLVFINIMQFMSFGSSVENFFEYDF